MKHLTLGTLLTAVFLLGAPAAFAHSTVAPANVPTATYQTFTLSVPTEREVPTTNVVLMVPEGLERVTPFVKPGWTITMTKDADGNVTQVEWSGGSIPAGLKDTFEFTARTPQQTSTLVWKVYQTYAGGERVAWDQAPHEENGAHDGEGEVKNPYSKTEVADTPAEKAPSNAVPLGLSVVALVLSLSAIALARKNA